jgi:hypothetical protein
VWVGVSECGCVWGGVGVWDCVGWCVGWFVCGLDRSGSHVFHSCMLVSHGSERAGCGCSGSNVVTLKYGAESLWTLGWEELNSRNSAMVLRRSSFGMRHCSNIVVSDVVIRESRSVI